jgi:AraC-like DNA-binding protein
MRHLAKVRLGQAAGYLATGDLSVDAIARRTGYASNASLSKAFKREFGVSPGAYRRSGGDAGLLPGGRPVAAAGLPEQRQESPGKRRDHEAARGLPGGGSRR